MTNIAVKISVLALAFGRMVAFAQEPDPCQDLPKQFDRKISEIHRECPDDPNQAPSLEPYRTHQKQCAKLSNLNALCSNTTGNREQTAIQPNPGESMEGAYQHLGGHLSQTEDCREQRSLMRSCMVWDERVFRSYSRCENDLGNAETTARAQLKNCQNPAVVNEMREKFAEVENSIRKYWDFYQAQHDLTVKLSNGAQEQRR